MGAKKLGLLFRNDGVAIDVKWKAAPSGGDGWNNSPPREIAAYAVQALFLDPDDYVVPPAAARCIPLDVYRAVDSAAQPNLAGTRCAYGVLSAWLQNVTEPSQAFDPQRFSHDPRYAFHFGNLNLLTYLIDHRDARGSNFLMSTDPENPQVFAVDNGIAFGGVLYNFFTWHFDHLVVNAVPKQSIERLRHVSHAALAGFAVLGELEVNAAGILRPVTPTANLDPNVMTRLAPDRIQFGLTAAQIDAIAQRLQTLLAKIDAGEIGVF